MIVDVSNTIIYLINPVEWVNQSVEYLETNKKRQLGEYMFIWEKRFKRSKNESAKAFLPGN